ncbi:MAG: hypothetical protein AB8G99_26985 [Planctomycetaceae bacterium]
MSSNPYDHTDVGTVASRERFAKEARQVQIICAALVMGCVVFAMLGLVIKGVSNEVYENASVVTWLGVVLGSLLLVQSVVVPMMIARRKADSVDGWFGIYRIKTIVGMAICEGAAFFNVVAYIIDVQLISLGVVVLLLLRMFTFFPTAGGLENWLSNRMRTAEQGF